MSDLKMIRISSKLDTMFRTSIDLSDLTNRPQNELDSAFYTRATAALALMIICNIDETAAANCVTDGYNDMGIDAIYCDELQKILVLVQSKFSQNGNSTIGEGDLLKFIGGVDKIVTLDFDSANPKILSHKSKIDEAIRSTDYQVKLVVCHTGNQNMSETCKSNVERFMARTNDDSNELLIFEELYQTTIYDYLASGQAAASINIDDVILYNWGRVDQPYTAYYGTIKGSTLAGWHKTYGNRLFDRNIRFYKGHTDVNDGMKKAVQEAPEDFFYFNNGVKALCSKISRKAANSTDNKTGIFSLEGLALVNGAQTTGVIGSLYDDYQENVANISILIQLIDLENTPPQYDVQITKFSNTQNRIDNKDFASLDPQQSRLHSELAFENVEYLFKAGASILNSQRQASIDEAIIALACFQDDVTYAATAKRNVGALVENVTRQPYIILFNASVSGFAVWNCVRIMRETDRILKEKELSYQSKDRLALVHGNRFMLHMVFQKYKEYGYNLGDKLINDQTIGEQTIIFCDELIPKQIQSMLDVYPDAYPAHIFKNVGRCREVKVQMGKTLVETC